MDNSTCPSSVDLNDPWTLSAYKQMLFFQNEPQKQYLVFDEPDHAQQNVLQLLAHRPDLGLEYEYSLVARQAFVSRQIIPKLNQSFDTLWDQFMKAPSIFDSLDLALQDSNNEPIPLFLQPGPSKVDEDLVLSEFLATPVFNLRDNAQLMELVEVVEKPADEDIQVSNQSSVVPSAETESYYYGPAFSNPLGDTVYNFLDTRFITYTAQNTYIPQNARTDRTSSIGSIHSNTGRGRVGKILSRVSSSRSTAGSMFSCFDSKSTQSGVTNTSTSSRRSRRAMDQFAKAAMEAVKAIGACWRCKILRKQCDDQSPCESCPTGSSKSDWKLLGCKRGLLADNVLPVLLCPALPGNVPKSYEARSKDRDTAININNQSQLRKRVRDDDMKSDKGAVLIGTLDSFLQAVDCALSDINGVPKSFAVAIGEGFSSSLKPLDECVGSIIWELSYSEGLQKILGGFTMDSLAVLLRSASLYQVRNEDDQLVAQSLLCLRDCLEVLSLKQDGHLNGFSHLSCTRWIDSTVCGIGSIENLEANISRYIKELSRVFFQKEKMRNMRTWWLSVFYSLCIQHFVRKALLRLQIDVTTGTDSKDASTGAEQYLHLALRLFLAYSRKYDPLMQKSPREFGATMTPEDETFSNQISIARLAVRHNSWEAVGINSSKDYLKLILEDKGQKIS